MSGARSLASTAQSEDSAVMRSCGREGASTTASAAADAAAAASLNDNVDVSTTCILTEQQAALNLEREKARWADDVANLDNFVLPLRKSALWKAANASTTTNWLRNKVNEGGNDDEAAGAEDMRDDMH